MAAEDRPCNALLVEQPDNVAGHLLKSHRGRVLGLAVVAQVDGQDAARLALGSAVVAQPRGPALEVAARAEQAWPKSDWGQCLRPHVVAAHPVCLVGLDCRRERERERERGNGRECGPQSRPWPAEMTHGHARAGP